MLKICLYTAIPEREQFRRLVRPPFQRARSSARHALNRLWTNLSGSLQFDDFHYQIANDLDDNSNRGDIAIRIAVRQQISDAMVHHKVEFIEIKWGELTNEIVDDINRECDLFVICGGGYIFIFGDGSGGRCFEDLPYLKNIRCPIVAYGIGMNRLMHETVCDLRDLPSKTQSQVSDFSVLCSSIGVRDTHTLDLLKLYGGRPVSLIGDPVLFLNDARAVAVGVKFASGPSIGINLAAHGWRALAVLKPLLADIIQLLKYVQSSYGVTYTYLLHHDFEEMVVSFLRKQGIQMTVVRADALTLLNSYGELDFVICQMLHSCIFSANREVPFFNIAYDQKSVAFCDLLDVPLCVLPHWDANLENLKGRFVELFEGRTALKNSLIAAKRPLASAQKKFAQDLMCLTEVITSGE